ncbi:hypothetical protein KAX97_05345 [candidate division WOR-3 bacterium]|nr:hypothetical protein [candidate division WOR-3 bacterium]
MQLDRYGNKICSKLACPAYFVHNNKEYCEINMMNHRGYFVVCKISRDFKVVRT